MDKALARSGSDSSPDSIAEAVRSDGAAIEPNALSDSDVHTLGFDDTVAAEMPLGSVVICTGRTVHGGGANTSAYGA